MDAKLIFRAATSLLAVAVAFGIVMAGIRFFTDRQSPVWMPKVHGYAAVAALSLLCLGWAGQEFSQAASFGLATLLVAAAGGVMLSLGYRGKNKPLPEGLVFAHMAVAFVGSLVIGMVLVSLTA